jgi:hypothetical protein
MLCKNGVQSWDNRFRSAVEYHIYFRIFGLNFEKVFLFLFFFPFLLILAQCYHCSDDKRILISKFI